MSNKNKEPVTLDDLDYFWMANGAPCFMADREDICEVVEGLGFQIYYLIADIAINKEVKGKDKQLKEITWIETTLKARVLKVVNNIIGRSVSETDDEFGQDILASVEESATYNMPKIPKTIVKKLDEFFRLVHAQHGTESIVILTFDPNVNTSDGWGVLVPEQTNTSVHCKYDADSIVNLKPDHVIIVGSVHSHPEMAAYASGTDHEDQADFDGIHITYGWIKTKNGGATEYHAEMQMNGTAYLLNIEDVFEDITEIKDPDPEVVEWSGKVKKVSPPPYKAGVTQGLTTGHPQARTGQAPGQASGHTATTGINYYGGRSVPSRKQVIPFQMDEYDGQLVAEIDTYSNVSMTCPSCQLYLFKADVEGHGYCPACDIPLAPKNASLQSVEFAVNHYLMTRQRETAGAYYLWCTDHKNEHFLIQIKPDELDSRDIAIGSRIDDFAEYADSDEQYAAVSLLNESSGLFLYAEDVTLCCASPADRAWTECQCSPTVYWEDIEFFEKAANNIEIYAANSICQTCAFYNLPECDAYRMNIVEFVSSKELPSKAIDGCDSWVDFSKVANDIDSGIYDSY
jgi:hypothetical protein